MDSRFRRRPSRFSNPVDWIAQDNNNIIPLGLPYPLPFLFFDQIPAAVSKFHLNRVRGL
jgi:hypothetical protein